MVEIEPPVNKQPVLVMWARRALTIVFFIGVIMIAFFTAYFFLAGFVGFLRIAAQTVDFGDIIVEFLLARPYLFVLGVVVLVYSATCGCMR